METLTFALVCLILSIGLFLRTKKREGNIYQSFGFLCLFLFFYRGGSFFSEIHGQGFWLFIQQAGLIGLPPALIKFTDALLRGRERRTRRLFFFALITSVLLFFLVLSDVYRGHYQDLLHLYLALCLIYSLLSIWNHGLKKSSGSEKRGFTYLIAAAAIAVVVSSPNIFFDLTPISLVDFAGAGLVYFTWLIITYPQLTKLHELMARAAGVLVISLVGALFFLAIVKIGGGHNGHLFTHALIASFLIVISISPLKLILERIFLYFYPEGKDLFLSFYEMDRRLEREKALLLEEMAPVFAHEIRNPLGSIKGAAQYLKGETGVEQARLLNVIIEETDRLNRVVSQFLDYAKPYEINPSRQDIVPLINKAISLIETHAQAGQITIEKDIHEKLPPIPVDGEQIMQVILNIAVNAIEAMPNGGVLSFKTSLVKINEEVVAVGINIRDTGLGIAKEDRKNIFKPFFTTKKRGVGLGLAICKKIINQHGGSIKFKSLVNQGTVFSIRLNTRLP